MVATFKEIIGKKANRKLVDSQEGDVPCALADIEDMQRNFDYTPKTELKEGPYHFYEWYKAFYKL